MECIVPWYVKNQHIFVSVGLSTLWNYRRVGKVFLGKISKLLVTFEQDANGEMLMV